MTDIIVITKSIAFNSSAFCKYFIAIIIEATITAIGNMQNRIARITTNSPTKINFNTRILEEELNLLQHQLRVQLYKTAKGQMTIRQK